MAKPSGGFNKEKARATVKRLDAEISAMISAMKALEKDLDLLQNGDADGPYWNGQKAYKWVKNSLANLDHNKTLVAHLDNISDYLDQLVRGASAL